MTSRQASRFLVGVLLSALLATASASTWAGVVIAGTRVIYDAQASEVTVRLQNEGTVPALVQTWIDHGDTQQAPADIEVPFVVTPPIARIDPTKGQTLRIVYTGEPLSRDKESVFWLNVLEVPPKPGTADAAANTLQLAFHSRIKLFFRPSDLKGNSRDAPGTVAWHFVEADGKPALEAYNPSAYHVSFTRVSLSGNGGIGIDNDGGMVGPGERRIFPLTGWTSSQAPREVHFTTLNDLGGPDEGSASLSGAAASPPE